MDYRLLYTQRALNDLAEIIGHIADDDAEALAKAVERPRRGAAFADPSGAKLQPVQSQAGGPAGGRASSRGSCASADLTKRNLAALPALALPCQN